MPDIDYLTEWSHWRGEMTIKLSDVCRRIDNLEEGMDNTNEKAGGASSQAGGPQTPRQEGLGKTI